MSDRTTINVDKGQHEATREVKEEYGDSWPDVLAFYERHRPTVQVGGATDNTQPFDWSEFDERLQEHLAEWEITVNMDQLDLDTSKVSEEDVRTWVEAEIRDHVADRANNL